MLNNYHYYYVVNRNIKFFLLVLRVELVLSLIHRLDGTFQIPDRLRLLVEILFT